MHMLSDDDDDDDIYIGYIGYIFCCEVFCELLHMFSWVIGKLICFGVSYVLMIMTVIVRMCDACVCF